MTSRALHADRTGARTRRRWFAVAALVPALIAGKAFATNERGLLAAPQNLVADGADAASRGKPVVILFSLPGCTFCEVVRKNYLSPLLRVSERERPVIREVDIGGSDTFTDFNGNRITHSAFANRYRARFAPTVMMLDGGGQPVTAPIVGGDTAGLYGGYLDNAFAEAASKLAARRPVSTSGK